VEEERENTPFKFAEAREKEFPRVVQYLANRGIVPFISISLFLVGTLIFIQKKECVG